MEEEMNDGGLNTRIRPAKKWNGKSCNCQIDAHIDGEECKRCNGNTKSETHKSWQQIVFHLCKLILLTGKSDHDVGTVVSCYSGRAQLCSPLVKSGVTAFTKARLTSETNQRSSSHSAMPSLVCAHRVMPLHQS
jgi:hypothetical protein